MKKCHSCKTDKEEKFFRHPGSLNCNACVRKIRTKIHKRQIRKTLHDKHPELVNYLHYIKRRYGANTQWYFDTLQSQGNVCAICKREPTKKPSGRIKYCVDHNHGTKQIRGLLCSSCNTIIGLALENPHILENAIKYLGKYNV